jgi:DNA-binding IclR family transcriptional regulator
LVAFTERTTTDRASLAAEVAEVAARGWAQSIGEREDDLNAIAAPVRGDRGELAAILGVQGPAGRFTRERMRTAVEPLLEQAAAIATALGFRE